MLLEVVIMVFHADVQLVGEIDRLLRGRCTAFSRLQDTSNM